MKLIVCNILFSTAMRAVVATVAKVFRISPEFKTVRYEQAELTRLFDSATPNDPEKTAPHQLLIFESPEGEHIAILYRKQPWFTSLGMAPVVLEAILRKEGFEQNRVILNAHVTCVSKWNDSGQSFYTVLQPAAEIQDDAVMTTLLSRAKDAIAQNLKPWVTPHRVTIHYTTLGT